MHDAKRSDELSTTRKIRYKKREISHNPENN